jgi:hypothetical protein
MNNWELIRDALKFYGKYIIEPLILAWWLKILLA